eukprot:scaffold65133_cov60-Phaeocystis_antarctica.AAC.2
MSGEAKRTASGAWPGALRATNADPGSTSPLPDACRRAINMGAAFSQTCFQKTRPERRNLLT